jgi:predicted Zn-dependent protease
MAGPFEPPDCHYLLAAEGWLELGDHREAAAELLHISVENATHPAVLELYWQIYANERQWDNCVSLAEQMVAATPELPTGWIHRSYALHELKRTAEARDQLLPAVSQFPEEVVLTYNLACYECCLGNLTVAKQWLRKTFAHKNSAPWKLAAQKDRALRALWPEIAAL